VATPLFALEKDFDARPLSLQHLPTKPNDQGSRIKDSMSAKTTDAEVALVKMPRQNLKTALESPALALAHQN